MNVHAKWVLGIVVGCLLLLGGYEYMQEHDARLKAEAIATEDAKVIAANQQAIATRDAADQKQQAAAIAEAKAIKTAPQAARAIIKYVPLPASVQPQVVTLDKQDIPPAEQAKLPDAPGYVVMTQEAATATAQQLVECHADQSSLNVCQADKKDLTSSLKAETDTAVQWKKAAKGTFWRRTGTALKWAAIGAGIGYLAAKR